MKSHARSVVPFARICAFVLLVSTKLRIRAWNDDLVAVLFEFLDDDTMLAQSCTDSLYVHHWYTVVPDPTMRVTLWALTGIGKDCEVCHTTGPLTPFCVCSLCLLREVGQGIV